LRQSRVRTASRRRPSPRRSRYIVSSANGSRTFSTAALSESPACSFTNQRHTSEAVKVCRGKTSARKKTKVRPQPPRRPRLEQNTRWPRQVWPSGVWGSLPSERLWRFNAPTQPQCGHGDCLSEKGGFSTPAHRAQNEKADGTSRLPARRQPESSSLLRPSQRRNSVQKGLRKEGTALTALRLRSDRKLTQI
jgi:hypothetical protein